VEVVLPLLSWLWLVNAWEMGESKHSCMYCYPWHFVKSHYYCSYYVLPYSLQRRSASSSSPISIMAWTKSLYEACGQLFGHVLNTARMHLSWSRGLLNSMLCRTQSSMFNWSPRLYHLVTCTLTSSFGFGWEAAFVRNKNTVFIVVEWSRLVY